MSGLIDTGARPAPATVAARDQAEELCNWRDNTPLLYSYLSYHILEWPSLTCEVIKAANGYPIALNKETSTQSFILGTHTSGEDNSVIFYEVDIPSSPIDADQRVYDHHEDYAGFAYGNEGCKFHRTLTVPHPIGEPNKIRALPGTEGDIFATISVGGSATVFDIRQHKQDPSANNLATISLMGHDREGWGLSWSDWKPGWLATAADDKKVCVWDVKMCPPGNLPALSGSSSIKPVTTYIGHSRGAQDVTWHPSHDALLISVGDDGLMIIWDIRTPERSIQSKIQCSQHSLNSISVNPFQPSIMATGGVDPEVQLWDYRQLSAPVHKFTAHENPVTKVQFSQNNYRYLLSAGQDRFVYVWDLSAIGKEQTPEDAADGPPELMFTHAGHTGMINDAVWFPRGDWGEAIVSFSDANQMQLWRMSEGVLEGCSDDEELEDDFEVE